MHRNATLVWFRLDLRLADNPALAEAAKRGTVIPIFIHAPEEENPWAPGRASNWWLHHSLLALQQSLERIASSLVIRRGPTISALTQLIRETGATSIYWNERHEPAVRARDHHVAKELAAMGIETQIFNASLLHDPLKVRNSSGAPFQVFTPFWNHCLRALNPGNPIPPVGVLQPPTRWPTSEPVHALGGEQQRSSTAMQIQFWTPGEQAATRALAHFVETRLATYTEDRNRPALPGTSRLSPHLHFGEISPRQAWKTLEKHAIKQGVGRGEWMHSQFVTELGWREFSHHLLVNFPHTTNEPLRERFRHFSWRRNPDWLNAWKAGVTGFPIVDAGNRELLATGWMHNRVRMIAASFLVKDMLTDWREGARWFWENLVDADLAQNTLGWQWTAGCGADAAPFFRIFNPVAQGERFDPGGDYVRGWIPELARLPAHWIHKPHLAPVSILDAAGVPEGPYRTPILSHAIAREVALEAYARTKRVSSKE